MDRPLPLRQQWIDHIDTRYQRPNLGGHWRNLSIAIIPVALLSVAFALAAHKPPPPPSQQVVRGDKFGDRYPELPPSVVPVRTIAIVPPAPEPQLSLPPPPPVEVAAAEADPPPQRVRSRVREPKRSGDVCRQHGKKKVMVGRYRWRCR